MSDEVQYDECLASGGNTNHNLPCQRPVTSRVSQRLLAELA